MAKKPLDHSADYLSNKKEIFNDLLKAIELALESDCSKIYVKNIKIMEETTDVIANITEWPTILEKAKMFFESLEDYEMCHRCKTIETNLATKKKKSHANRKKKTSQRNTTSK